MDLRKHSESPLLYWLADSMDWNKLCSGLRSLIALSKYMLLEVGRVCRNLLHQSESPIPLKEQCTSATWIEGATSRARELLLYKNRWFKRDVVHFNLSVLPAKIYGYSKCWFSFLVLGGNVA